MLRRLLSLAALLLVAVLPVSAQALVGADGRLNLAGFDALFSTEPEVEMDLTGAMLGAVSRSFRRDDPELATVVSQMRGLQMLVYPLAARDRAAVISRMQGVGNALRQQGWRTMMRVRQDGGYVDMLLRDTGADPGFLMLVVDDADDPEPTAVVMNLMGRLDLDEATRIGTRLRGNASGRSAAPPARRGQDDAPTPD